MENEAVRIFKSLMKEVDKIEDTLLNLQRKKVQDIESIPGKITECLNSLESILQVFLKNTDIKTMKVDDGIFNFASEQVKSELRKIGLLSRRIEREINEHDNIVERK